MTIDESGSPKSKLIKQGYKTENPQFVICLPKGSECKSIGLFDDAKRTKKTPAGFCLVKQRMLRSDTAHQRAL